MKETLASVLKEARLHAGFLQEDAAKYLGVRRSTIGNYENGRSKPNIERFILLCKFYKVDFVRLFIRLYGDNYIPEKTRDSLLESISEEILHQDTVVLQNIEWILSAKHGVPMNILMEMIKLFLHLDSPTRIHVIEWLLGCYYLLKEKKQLENTNIMEPDVQKINELLKNN